MAVLKRVALFNRVVTNRLTRVFAGRIPPFALLEHVGRKSAKIYRTPIFAFPIQDGMLIALTYGKDTDWIKNVFARGSCAIEYRGRRYQLHSPRLSHSSPSAQPVPAFIQFMLRLLDVNDFLYLTQK